MSLRLDKDEAKYQLAKREGRLVSLLEIPRLREFKYWFIARNDFHHSKISDEGDMLILKRKCIYRDLRLCEVVEKHKIEQILESEGQYHKIDKNFSNTQSVKDIVHFHLQVLKEEMRT